MENQSNIKTIIPLVVMALVIAGGLIYWQKNNQSQENKLASSHTDQGGIVLGDYNQTNQPVNNNSSGASDYAKFISDTRAPINAGFEELMEKSKYTSLFNQDDIQKIIDDTRAKTEKALEDIKNISLAENLKLTNDKHIQSLNFLLEAINAYDRYRQETDKKEAQKQKELFDYSVNQSNKVLKEIPGATK